jgi:hypothetical protein
VVSIAVRRSSPSFNYCRWGVYTMGGEDGCEDWLGVFEGHGGAAHEGL